MSGGADVQQGGRGKQGSHEIRSSDRTSLTFVLNIVYGESDDAVLVEDRRRRRQQR